MQTNTSQQSIQQLPIWATHFREPTVPDIVSIPAQHWHMTCAQGGDVFSFAGASESDEVPAGSIEKECVNRL